MEASFTETRNDNPSTLQLLDSIQIQVDAQTAPSSQELPIMQRAIGNEAVKSISIQLQNSTLPMASNAALGIRSPFGFGFDLLLMQKSKDERSPLPSPPLSAPLPALQTGNNNGNGALNGFSFFQYKYPFSSPPAIQIV